MQSLYSANPTKQPPQQPQWGQRPQAPSAPPTFGQMQQQGQPRPAPPPSWYSYRPGTTPQTAPQPNAPPRPQAGGGFQTPPPPNMPAYYGGPQAPAWNGGSPAPAQPPQAPQASQFAMTPQQMTAQGGGMTDQGYAPPSVTPQQQPPPNPMARIWSDATRALAPVTAIAPGFGQAATSAVQRAQSAFGNPQFPQPPQAPPGISAAPPPNYGATPPATSQTQDTANQLGTATQNLLLNQLQNPNPLGAQSYQTQLQQAQTQLNEQYKQQQDQINQNLASRGVFDSSLAGGYLSDLNTAQGRQMASIAANLLPQEAQLGLEGTNSAISNMLGYGGQQFGQQATTAQINLAQQAQQQQQLQQMLQLSGY